MLYRTFFLTTCLCCALGVARSQSTPPPGSATPKTNSVFDELVWADEFDVAGPVNAANWFHQTKLPAGGSWYNGEIQHYTDRVDNARVENGVLHIIAKKENYFNQGHAKQYTSARLNSKFAFKYGRVEVRAKLPSGVGTWPAIWTLGKNITEDGAYWQTQGFGTTGWPACGEIDIMEHWGAEQNFVQSATHTPSSSGNTVNKGGRTIATASTEFHVYALEWTAEKLVFSVDDVVHYTYAPSVKNASTWPFDAEQYLLLNFAILPSIAPSFSSDALEVDYVRVYQQSTSNVAAVPVNTRAVTYPNPFDGALTINLDRVTDQSTLLSIYGVDGRLVHSDSIRIADHTLRVDNLDFLAAGVYFVKFKADDRRYFIRAVKN